MGSAPSRSRQRKVGLFFESRNHVRGLRSRQSGVGRFLESGESGKEELIFNPETGKLEVVNVLEARLRPGRKVVTAMNKRGGGGFFIRLTCT